MSITLSPNQNNICAPNDALFFGQTGLDKHKAEKIVQNALKGADDGELFLEYSQSEGLYLEDGAIKSATFDTSRGFGLRAVAHEATAYAHGSEISESALNRASQTASSVLKGYQGKVDIAPNKTNQRLYTDDNPLPGIAFEKKVALLSQVDAYARSLDPRIKQVMATLAGEWQVVTILRADGTWAEDIRPLVRLNVSVLVDQGGRLETGTAGGGGRFLYNALFEEDLWQHYTQEALRQAVLNLDAIPAPAGEMPVVLGAGWPGVLLHEAVGHGLEGDFNRKQTSTFSGQIGKKVAAKGVTVVDDGTIPNRRGSLTIDDEGTPTQRNVLIQNGILVGYLQDRMNARLMGVKPTGNGRRESFSCAPMPRMTNTFMENGSHTVEDMIKSVKRGIYAANFGGGQVDITSGKFVFSTSEAYLIEDGKVTQPVKGATLIGNGPETMKKITMIGNDLKLDPGVGTCGKDGQSVPVGVGQPSLLISSLTVGGTAL